MSSTILITVGVTLLSLAAGMFLLAKTNKDALGLLYKIVSWFIIIASLLNLGCAAIHCLMKLYGKQYKYEMMMHDKMGKKMHKEFKKKDRWHHRYGGMHEDGYGKNGYKKDNCMDACYDGQMGKQDYCWKKCYEQLKDSCLKKEDKILAK